MYKTLLLSIFSLSLMCLNALQAQQDIDKEIQQTVDKAKQLKERLKNDPIKINGAISSELIYNYINGVPARRDPFSYRLSASLNIDILGVKVPLAANIANGRTIYNVNLPAYKIPSYALIGLSPSNKWGTLHLGNRSMTFSSYTLSGHSFYGIGAEVKPGNFYAAAMYGRLQRAVAADLNTLNNLEPAYNRFGWGTKLGYDNGKDNIYAVLFKAWDQRFSIPTPPDSISSVRPMDNVVISVMGKKHLTDRLYISTEYAYSALTTNSHADEIASNIGLLKRMGGLFTPRTSTDYHSAIKSNIGILTSSGNVQVNHEWVGPGYRTLGALFFNNDFENWTVSTMGSFLKKKITLTANFGIQRNNLSGESYNVSRRFIGMLNAAVIVNEQLNLNASYSNFQSTNKIRTSAVPFLQVDSLILSQVNQNASFSANYVQGEEKNKIWTLMLSYQKANSIQNEEVQENQNMTNYMGHLSYNYVFPETKLSLASSFLANYNNIPQAKVLSVSPSLSASCPFFEEKLKATSSIAYVLLSTNKQLNSNILTLRGNLQYQFLEKHQLGMNAALINRSSKQLGIESFTEFTGLINYNFRF